MGRLTTIVHWLVRVVGTILLLLGIVFWTGNALALIRLHIMLGMALVLLLWLLALLAARAGVRLRLVALALVWGAIVPVLGMTQSRLLPGSAHWVIRLLHLLVGMVAISLGESLGARIKRLRQRLPRTTGQVTI